MPFVRFRDCTCPESPHAVPSPAWGDLDGDVVELRDRLPFEAAAIALRRISRLAAEATAGRPDANADSIELEVASRLFETVGPLYLEHGPVRWNVPGPLDIESLPFEEQYLVAEAANDLYTEAVLRPLVTRISKLSVNGSTAKPRQRRPTSSPKHQARSRRSS